MEDMAAIVSYGYDGDHVESDDSVESSLDHYDTTVEKKPRLVHYETEKLDEDEDEDEDNKLSVEEKKKIDKKFKVWSATIKDEDTYALFETTGASILEMDGHKLMQTNPTLLYDLVSLLRMCRRRMTIHTFTHPDEHDLHLDGGAQAYESSELSDLELQSYSNKTHKVIQQYNQTVTYKHSDSHSQLEFASLTRVVYIFMNHIFITFTARQNVNAQIGTYQAALCDDCFNDEVHVVLLRHVEADKILAILSIYGAEEELKKKFG